MTWLTRAVVLLAIAAPLAAQLPESWQHWRYSAPIGAPPATAGRLIAVPVPKTVTERARRDWIDLRVIDAAGAEVPFVLHARLGGTTFDRRLVPVLEPTQVPGAYRQVIADAGDRAAVHNSVRLRFSTDQNLLSWVEIAVSSDLADWRVVRERAPIYVLRAEGRGENTDVSYPDSVSRYVRIRVLDGVSKYTILSVELGRETSAPVERVASGIALTTSPDGSGDTIWISEGDASAIPISRVQFGTTHPSFVRAATVESSDDGERWRHVADGDILRAAGDAGERAWLTIDFPEVHARRWRVAVHNRNDAPIADLQSELLTAPRRVVLRQDPGASYRLLYGNPRAPAPRYDMGRLTDVRMLEAAEPATLGAAEENPAWIDPSPWTERYEAVLWVALVIAVVLLGVVAVRTLRTSSGG